MKGENIPLSGRNFFSTDQIVPSLALSDNYGLRSLHENFGKQRTSIIGRGHDKPIGSGTHQRNTIPLSEPRHLSILGKEITAFTDRADDIDLFKNSILRFDQWFNFMMLLIESRTDQIIHSGIHDHEIFCRRRFSIEHGRKKHSRIANKETAWLKKNP